MEPIRLERYRRRAGPLLRSAALALACLASSPAQACWHEVASWYGINVHLLYAIAKTESNLNPNAINKGNKNGSYDIGLMQINSAGCRRCASTGQRGEIEGSLRQPPGRGVDPGAEHAAHGRDVGGGGRLQRPQSTTACQVRTKGVQEYTEGDPRTGIPMTAGASHIRNAGTLPGVALTCRAAWTNRSSELC